MYICENPPALKVSRLSARTLHHDCVMNFNAKEMFCAQAKLIRGSPEHLEFFVISCHSAASQYRKVVRCDSL